MTKTDGKFIAMALLASDYDYYLVDRRDFRGTHIVGPITQACASRMKCSEEWRHEGVSVAFEAVHSGFPKDFTNFGLDLSIFPARTE